MVELAFTADNVLYLQEILQNVYITSHVPEQIYRTRCQKP
jgi:hypothetical protein